MRPTGRADRSTRKRPTHRTQLDGLSGSVTHQCSRLSLAEAVSDRKAPRGSYAFYYLRVERLAGARDLSQLDGPPVKFLLNQHPPHGRRCAKRCHTAAHELVQQSLRIESVILVRKHRSLCVPG